MISWLVALLAMAATGTALAHAALVTGFGLARGPKSDLRWRWNAKISLPELLLKVSAPAGLRSTRGTEVSPADAAGAVV